MRLPQGYLCLFWFDQLIFSKRCILQQMGRIFIEHLGGEKVIQCHYCETPLSHRGELVSTRFTGATGRAFLFNRVVNVIYSEVQVFVFSFHYTFARIE